MLRFISILAAALAASVFFIFVYGDARTSGLYTQRSGVNTTLGTEIATTSLSSHDFTGIPAGTTVIYIMLDQVSTNGTANLQIQIGDAGGIETTGYVGGVGGILAVAADSANMSSAFDIVNVFVAINTYSGMVMLVLQDSTNFTWTISGIIGSNTGGSVDMSGGIKALTGELTQLRLLTADTFDAGAFNIRTSIN